MTVSTLPPPEFIARWEKVKLPEKAAAQSHFNDLCDMIGHEKPVVADPAGEWFTFERGAQKIGGGQGWADVWKRNCFGWEYKTKGKHATLKKAYEQLCQYREDL